MGQLDDVVHQSQHPAGLAVDLLPEGGHVLGAGEAGLDHLGVARDAGQRGLELMADVGGELLAHLFVALPHGAVGVDGVGKGDQLPVGDVLLDVVEVVGHPQHGPDQAPGQKAGQQRRAAHDDKAADQDGGQGLVVEGPDGLGVLAGAQDVAVVQQHRVVIGLVAGGGRVPDVLALAGGKRLLDLGAGEVVFHLGLLVGVGGLIEDLPAGGDQCHPDAVRVQGLEAVRVVAVLGGDEGGFVFQRTPGLLGKSLVKDEDADRHRHHQAEKSHQVQPAADGLLHAAGPHSSAPSSLSASL